MITVIDVFSLLTPLEVITSQPTPSSEEGHNQAQHTVVQQMHGALAAEPAVQPHGKGRCQLETPSKGGPALLADAPDDLAAVGAHEIHAVEVE